MLEVGPLAEGWQHCNPFVVRKFQVLDLHLLRSQAGLHSHACVPPVSSVPGILWARILEWVAMGSPGDLPDPGAEPATRKSP